MRILLFKTEPKPVNINQYNVQVIGLARALVNMGHTCDIIFWSDKGSEKKKIIDVEKGQITIYLLRGISLFGNGIFYGYKRIIEQYDVVQVTGYTQITSWILYSGDKYKTILYQGPYTSDYSKRYNIKFAVFNTLLGWKKNKNTPVLAKNNNAADDMRKVGFKNVRVVGVGLNDDPFRQEVSKHDRNQLDRRISGNAFKLLYIGRIEDRRNTLFMIEVISAVVKRGCNIRLDIIGGAESKYFDRCKKMVKEYSLENHISFLGKKKQNELSKYYFDADLFLLPTKYEPFGMVIMESMYHSLPVLSSSNGGADILIEDGVNGFIRPIVTRDWVDCIIDLYNNRSKLEPIGNRAKTTIDEHFLWEKRALEFLETYEDLQHSKNI